MDKKLNDLVILIRGAGEMATGVAHRLASCHFKVCMTETSNPQAVRREVAFSEAIIDREKEVEGVTAQKIDSPHHILQVWSERKIPILIDPEAKVKDFMKPDVLIDATLAKKNLGTRSRTPHWSSALDRDSMQERVFIWSSRQTVVTISEESCSTGRPNRIPESLETLAVIRKRG
jgi:hypothetical protein